MSAEPTAERYRDSNGRDVWRIVCGSVVLQDEILSDRVAAESLAEYRKDAGRTDSADSGKRRGAAAVVGRSLKKFGRLCLSALTDGPTTAERWRMDNGESWEQIRHPDDGDDV
jgi:hypothetical protein